MHSQFFGIGMRLLFPINHVHKVFVLLGLAWVILYTDTPSFSRIINTYSGRMASWVAVQRPSAQVFHLEMASCTVSLTS
jgi:hypothetical protein